MATEIDILNSNTNEQQNYNSINGNHDDNFIEIDNNTNNNISSNPLTISKSREKRMTKLLIVGLILPFSVLLNIQSSEIPAWYKKDTKEPIYFPFSVVFIRTIGQIAGTIATIALLLKSVHIGSSFRILKWRFYKKHRGVVMIIGALIQCLCSLFILYYYYKNYRHNSDDYVPSETSYFTIQSIILSFLSVILLSKDANKRNRLFRQFGQKPKNRLSYMQRQLIVLEILVIFYIIIGGLIYSKLEGWTFNDAVYFAIITLMTCGTGDFSPSTFAGRLLLIVYAIPGILLTGYTVYSIYSVISEILYAKVYKDFSRFINVNNDIFFQNLVKHDQVVNRQNPLPSTTQDNNNNNTHEFDLPSTSTNIDLITCDEPLSITENDRNNENSENNNISTNNNTNNENANTNYENGLIILNTNISSSSSSSISFSNVNDENDNDKTTVTDNSNNQNRRRNLTNSYNVNISNWNNEDHYYYEPRHSILINDSTGIRFGPVYQYDDNDDDSSSSEDDSYYSDANNSESDHSELEHLINKKQNHNHSNINGIKNKNNNNNNNNNNNSSINSAVSSPINHIYNNELAKRSTSSLRSYYSRYSYQRNSYRKNIINANRYNSLNINDDNDSNNGMKSLMLTRRNTLNPNQNNVLKGMTIYSSSNKEIDAEKVLKQTRDLNFRQLKLSLGVLSLIIVFFSLIYSWIENWSFFEAVYFCFVNLCTIGYGDFVPKSVYGKSIFLYFIYIAVPSTTWLGTVLFEIATGRWEVYIEQTDLEDELIRNDFDRQIKIDSRKNSNESRESKRRKSKSKERTDE